MRGLRGSMTELELEGLRGERGDQGGREPLPNEKQPTTTAGMLAAAKLGNLPLALALAAAYMRACDVSCADYLRRLSSGEYPTALGMSSPRRRRPNGEELLHGYERGVAESFELSLAQLDGPVVNSSGGAAALVTSSLSGEFIHGSSARARRIGAVSTRQVLDVLSFCASEGIPKAFVTAVVLGTAACEEVSPPVFPPPVVPPPVEERNSSVNVNGGTSVNVNGGSSGPEAEGEAMAEEVRPVAQPSSWTRVAVACGVVSISAAVLAAAAPQRRRRAALVISALAAGLAAAAATACSTACAAADATEAVASALGQTAATPPAAAYSAQMSTKEEPGVGRDSFDDVQRLPAQAAFPTAPSCTMATHPLLLPADTEVFDGMNAEGEAQAVADRAWLRLKRFSLLTVREVHGERTGCLHRLLMKSLRAHMQPFQSARVLATCTWALERHWAFDAADTSTWSNATGTIEHVQAVGRHCLELLRQAADEAESGASSSSSSLAKSDPGAAAAEGSAASAEYQALLAALQLRVSALLTRGALCMSMALSRFDQANKALDAARAILDAQLPGKLPPRCERYDEVMASLGAGATRSGESIERLSVRALTLSTAGKVARYCGQLVEAEALLHEALGIWRACGERAGAAATLHELGVVKLRRADWAAATTLLQQSLDMKRELRAALPAAGNHVGALKRSAHTRQLECSYEEAATLHQLAVASMSCKPPRLHEAGALLREALALEDQGPLERCGGRAAVLRCGGRAATFQQLARVAERCGDHSAALQHLQEALAMHRRAYGEGVAHVNKAAVLSQLANLSLQGGEPDRAAAYLEQALAMRRRIYGHGHASHVEVALNLCKLGETDRARGGLPAAAAHFAEGRAVLEALVLRESGAPHGALPSAAAPADGRRSTSRGLPPMSPLQRIAWMVTRAGGGEGAPPSRLLNQLLQVIKWQRTVAKEASDVARAAELAAEEQQLRHAVDEASQMAEEGRDLGRDSRACTQERPLVPLMVSCRDKVRAELLTMRAAAADDSPTREHHLRTILRLADELARLAKAEAEAEAEAEAAMAAEAETEASVAEEAMVDGHSPNEVSRDCSQASLCDASLEFVSELREAAAGLGPAPAFVCRAFKACDVLRLRIRAEGITLTDLQAEDAYKSRAAQISQGDYMLSDKALAKLQATFGELTIDAFASGATAQLPRFWAAEAVEGAEGTDAFAQRWAGEHLLVHAPVSLLPDVIEKLEREQAASAVVVCPYWTGAPWYAPLERLASDSIILPPGSLRAIANRTGRVTSWRVVAFHVTARSAGSQTRGPLTPIRLSASSEALPARRPIRSSVSSEALPARRVG